MKVLLLVLHRKDRSPGQRYRIEQYIQYLNQEKVETHFSPLLKTEKEDKNFYSNKNYIPKVLIGIKTFIRRVKDVLSIGKYDIVLIFRDAFFFGTFFEKWIKKKNIKIIYDFDDAIWLMDENPNQGVFNKLKNPEKTATICRLADQVIVGNAYLAKYASHYNQNVTIIPSTIDFSHYVYKEQEQKEKVCIGWTGSFSTVKHFNTIMPALEIIKEKYEEDVYFKLIGVPSFVNKKLGLKGIPWKSETESKDLSELDIGLMPLPDNEWTRGKCAMKGLQYMALEIPTIMSPIGVNADIIKDGENGFLASSTEEWVEKLSLLIENPTLRKKMGKAGRKTVEASYSVEANKDLWLKAFQS